MSTQPPAARPPGNSDAARPTAESHAARRTSIDERAARRRELVDTHSDRYDALVDVLVHTRRRSLGPAVNDPARWHPVARKLVVGALLVIALVAIYYALSAFTREGRIDTWSGPTNDVTSGQRLLACLPPGTLADPYMPTWIRYDGNVFAHSGRSRALLTNAVGETGQVETGYTLDRMRILLPADVEPGETLRHVFVVVNPSPVAAIYTAAPACA